MYYGYGYGFNRVSSGVAVDPDAEAFITAASITDPTQQSAVNQLVLDLKSASIWTKMKAVYPFVGGSASSVKYNLKDPRDLDAAFRLTISGGVTYTNGFLSNGTNGYADTHFNPAVNSTDNNTSMGYASSTNSTGNYVEFGAAAGGLTRRFTLFNFASEQYCEMYNPNAGDGRVLVAMANTSGVFIVSRTASNSLKAYKAGSQIGATATGAGNSVSDVPFNLYLGALNNSGSSTLFTPRNLTFAFVGDGLTDLDASNITTAINTFNTALGR